MRQMMVEIQMLQQQLNEAQKQIPKQVPSRQGAQGKRAPQAGQRSMLGGSGPNSPSSFGVAQS